MIPSEALSLIKKTITNFPSTNIRFGTKCNHDVPPQDSKACIPLLILIGRYSEAIGQPIHISNIYRPPGQGSHDTYTEGDIWVQDHSTKIQPAFQVKALSDFYKIQGKFQSGANVLGFRVGHYLRLKNSLQDNITGDEIEKKFNGNVKEMANKLGINMDGGMHIGFAVGGVFQPLPHKGKGSPAKWGHWDCHSSSANGSRNDNFRANMVNRNGFLSNSQINSLVDQIKSDIEKLGVAIGSSNKQYGDQQGPSSTGQTGDPTSGQTSTDQSSGQTTASGDPAEKMTDLSYWTIVTNTIIEDWKLDG